MVARAGGDAMGELPEGTKGPSRDNSCTISKRSSALQTIEDGSGDASKTLRKKVTLSEPTEIVRKTETRDRLKEAKEPKDKVKKALALAAAQGGGRMSGFLGSLLGAFSHHGKA